MTTRPPAVAGSFYEGTPARLRAQVSACLAENPRVDDKQQFIAAVVPHAGLMYSGHVAGAFYGAADLPERYIILCPNHTGQGHQAAINRSGDWQTPFGNVEVDSELAAALMSKTKLLAEDSRAHAREHSLEVQLPFLQQLLGVFTFVPLCLATHRFDLIQEIGMAIAEVVAEEKEPIGILASSDLNHYEDQATTLRKDQQAIDQVLARDPRGLWDTVQKNGISMCGIIPTTTMLVAANQLGAANARLIKHATSGDINRDYTQVVGYASILIS
jgi:AmmeMemoRadiSam system protein B